MPLFAFLAPRGATMARIGLFQLDDISISGPGHPFRSGAVADSHSIRTTTFTIAPTARVIVAEIGDNDPYFSDADLQRLELPTRIDGDLWDTRTNVETEYSYIVRPVGSTDPADNITIYSVELDGKVHGITSTSPLVPGVEYQFVSIASNDPSVAWSRLFVCFARGTLIETARGLRPVEEIGEGERVQTADNGLQPVLWAGQRLAFGPAAAAVVFAPGVLGNVRALRLSPQHRVLVRLGGEEHLLPAKALLGRPGVRRASPGPVLYRHLLFERHELLLAEGALAESLLPGPMALASLAAGERARLFAVAPGLRRGGGFAPARALLRPGQWARLRHG